MSEPRKIAAAAAPALCLLIACSGGPARAADEARDAPREGSADMPPAARALEPAWPLSAPLPQSPAAAPLPQDYRLGAGDLLEVTVFEEESLNRTVRVGPDGAISLPLLGSIPAAGRLKSELEAEIVRRLAAQFLFDPQVSVFVKEYRSGRVAVLGAVNEPGAYEILGRRTLLEVISEAGGLAATAGRDLFVFGRAAGGALTRTRVDLQRLMHEGDARLNLTLSEGDIVHVPAERPFTVYLYGAVGQPGVVEARVSEGLTLLQAVARAGGPGQRAAVERIRILRGGPGRRETLRADLKKILRGEEEDPPLQPDDVVVVPESFF